MTHAIDLEALAAELKLPATLDHEQDWQNALRLVLPRVLPLRLIRQQAGRHKVERGGIVQGAPVGAADLSGWIVGRGVRVEIEVKHGARRVDPAQRRWLDALASDGCVALVLRYDATGTTLTNLYTAIETVRAALAAREGAA